MLTVCITGLSQMYCNVRAVAVHSFAGINV